MAARKAEAMTMISADYCRLMARYNAWQNRQLSKLPGGVPLGACDAERLVMDGRITGWAGDLSAARLAGKLRWYSGAAGRRVTRPLAACVAHMFNHQTHHRGQVHAMMTRAGRDAPVSDLFLMPEDAE